MVDINVIYGRIIQKDARSRLRKLIREEEYKDEGRYASFDVLIQKVM